MEGRRRQIGESTAEQGLDSENLTLQRKASIGLHYGHACF